MNPSLRYAQAIHGIATGRGTGIIDTIHLVEVARAIELLRRGAGLPDADVRADPRSGSPTTSTWMTTRPVRHRGAGREEQPRRPAG